jgi:hypothetical protein
MEKKFVPIDFFALPDVLMQIDEELKEYYRDVDLQLIGQVLHCHLRIENAIHKILNDFYAQTCQPAQLERLRFPQKLALLPRQGARPYPLPEEFHYENLLKACLELNTIRNKLAHNIHYKPAEKDLGEITKAIHAIEGDRVRKKTRSITDKLVLFSNIAERSLLIATDDFNRKLVLSREKMKNELKSALSRPRKRRGR